MSPQINKKLKPGTRAGKLPKIQHSEGARAVTSNAAFKKRHERQFSLDKTKHSEPLTTQPPATGSSKSRLRNDFSRNEDRPAKEIKVLGQDPKTKSREKMEKAIEKAAKEYHIMKKLARERDRNRSNPPK